MPKAPTELLVPLVYTAQSVFPNVAYPPMIDPVNPVVLVKRTLLSLLPEMRPVPEKFTVAPAVLPNDANVRAQESPPPVPTVLLLTVEAPEFNASAPTVSVRSPVEFAAANVPPFKLIATAPIRLAFAVELSKVRVPPWLIVTEEDDAIAPFAPLSVSEPPLTVVAPP